MKTNIYFGTTTGDNSVIFDRPSENYCIILDGDSRGFLDGVVDLSDSYERTPEIIAEELKHHLLDDITWLDPIDTSDTHFDYADREEFFQVFEELVLVGSYEEE